MAKFAENRKLYGSNSRVTKKHRGTATPNQVMDVVMSETGHFITNRKSEMREPVGRIIPRKLVSVTDSMTEDEKAMYIQLCQLAAQA
jgi:hypothetical protein